jgi:hypothetical protein
MIDDIYSFPYNISTNPEGHKVLTDFYNTYKEVADKEIILDFSRLSWIDANLCAFFGAILHDLKEENRHSFFVDGEEIKRKLDVLMRNGFVVDIDGQPLMNDDRYSTARLTKFYKHQDTEFITYISNDLLSHRALESHSGLKYNLIDHFAELFANIETHAKTDKPIFVCGQYYPHRGVFKFTIVDLGIGFFEPINGYTKGSVKTCKGAIEWALQGNSTKKDATGGLGLTSIYQYCVENDGGFHIVTGDAYWGNNIGTQSVVKVNPFLGTTIHLSFRC